MKVLVSLFLVAELVIGIQAQQPRPAQSPAEVVVIKHSWVKELIPGWEDRGSGHESFEMMIQRVANERRLQQARDAGNKVEVNRRQRDAKVLEKATGIDPDKEAAAGERSRFGYRYKMSLRNTGAKAIKAVDWDYVFLDSLTGSEVARHQFTSEEKIKPGKEKELYVFTLSPPSRTVSASALNKKGPSPFTEAVVVVRVEYSDGSVWQHP